MKLSDYKHIFIEHLKTITDEQFEKELKDAGIENQDTVCLKCTCFTCGSRCSAGTDSDCGLENCRMCFYDNVREFCKFA